jgi:hypothetical protein
MPAVWATGLVHLEHPPNVQVCQLLGCFLTLKLVWLCVHERVQFVDGNAKDPSSPVFVKPTLSNPNTDGALADVSDGRGLRSGDISSPGIRALLVEEMGEGRCSSSRTTPDTTVAFYNRCP